MVVHKKMPVVHSIPEEIRIRHACLTAYNGYIVFKQPDNII